MHAQLSAKEISGRASHQDDYCSDVKDAVVCFLQGGQTTNALVAKQKKQERLIKGRIYLDSMSSFNQVFTDKHLSEVSKVGVTLRDKCNAGVVYSDKKGFVLDMFNMWLVQNGIANLLSIPCLIHDGYCVAFDLLKALFVYCPDGRVLKFKTDVGTCKGFPYIDLKKLKDHIVTSDKSETFKEKLKRALKATKDVPKKFTYALV